MPILNVGKLRHKVKDALLELHDKSLNGKKLSKSELKALPEEFANPSTRKVIDEELCKNLSLDLKLDVLYKLLSKEPMLTG